MNDLTCIARRRTRPRPSPNRQCCSRRVPRRCYGARPGSMSPTWLAPGRPPPDRSSRATRKQQRGSPCRRSMPLEPSRMERDSGGTTAAHGCRSVVGADGAPADAWFSSQAGVSGARAKTLGHCPERSSAPAQRRRPHQRDRARAALSAVALPVGCRRRWRWECSVRSAACERRDGVNRHGPDGSVRTGQHDCVSAHLGGAPRPRGARACVGGDLA